MLITYSDDIVESLGVLKLLDIASTGTVLDNNVEYKRTQDFGCCQEDKAPVLLIVLICVAAVVVIGAVVAVIVVKSKKTKNLPKKTTVWCVCYRNVLCDCYERVTALLTNAIAVLTVPPRKRTVLMNAQLQQQQ